MKTLIRFGAAIFIFLAAQAIWAQTTAFNYQGKLSDGGTPASGNYLLQFKLYDAATGGSQIGSTVSDVFVTVSQGVFTTKIDFGATPFAGADRFLEIAVKKTAGDPYTTLTPRQQIASSPYSIRTLSAAQADVALDANKLGGINASEYVTTTNVGNSFIKNSSTQQTGNFNISGNGLFGGNVGIGTTSPNTRLTLFGGAPWTSNAWAASMNLQNASAFGWEANASGQRFGIGQTNGGLYFFRTNSAFGNTSNPANYDLVLADSGSVGIGTSAPTAGYRLDIAGGVRSFDSNSTHFVAQTTGGTNAWARYYLRTPSQGWFIGTSQNFNGNQLYIHDETANQTRMVIATNGNVGIGTTNPTTTLFVNGSVGQPASQFGLPKAMLLVRNNGVGGNATIEKCYNAVSGVLTGNCGFGINQPGGAGAIYISFPFRVSDRFISITPIYNSTLPATVQVMGFDASDISGGTVRVNAAGYNGDEADFYLIVY